MDRCLVHVRLYDPKRNPRSCERLPPAPRLRCEHHVAWAQTLDETSNGIFHHHGPSHVHLFDAKCVATPRASAQLLPSAVGQRWGHERHGCWWAIGRRARRHLAARPARHPCAYEESARSAPSVPACGAPRPWQRRVRKFATRWMSGRSFHCKRTAAPRHCRISPFFLREGHGFVAAWSIPMLARRTSFAFPAGKGAGQRIARLTSLWCLGGHACNMGCGRVRRQLGTGQNVDRARAT